MKEYQYTSKGVDYVASVEDTDAGVIIEIKPSGVFWSSYTVEVEIGMITVNDESFYVGSEIDNFSYNPITNELILYVIDTSDDDEDEYEEYEEYDEESDEYEEYDDYDEEESDSVREIRIPCNKDILDIIEDVSAM